MFIYDALLVLLGKKKRTTKHKDLWIAHANFSTSHPFRLLSDSNFFLLAMVIVSLQAEIFWMMVFFCCYFRFLNRLGRVIDHKHSSVYIEYRIVNFIQLKHNQSLKEYLMAEPALIDCLYKKKTLMHWSVHYKNHEAHKMIIALMKERSRRKR